MNFIKKPFRWAILYACGLTLAASYTLLDAFVIPKVQTVVQGQEASTVTSNADLSETSSSQTETSVSNTSQSDSSQTDTSLDNDQTTATQTSELINNQSESASETSTPSASPIITDSSYQDDQLSINITTQTYYDSQVHIAEIITEDPSLLKTAFAQSAFGRNIKETTSAMAEATGAILAINGDYYGFRDDGAVLRNGVLYRTTQRQGDITEALVISKDGTFSIIDEATTDIASMDTSNIAQILSFGPALVNDGVSTVTEGEEVDTRSDSILNPRTAIGMISPGHYVIVVVEGRTEASAGVSLSQLSQIFVDLGAQVAYNLDGGGSSTMVFNGQIINNPTTNGNAKEREVSDIVYFGY